MISIIDDIGKVVQGMRTGVFDSNYDDRYDKNKPPFYMAGHRIEISNRLSNKDIDPLQKNKKFPLIALNTMHKPFSRGDVTDFNLNIVIGTNVEIEKMNLNSEQRNEQIVKPILAPLYEKFKTAFNDSGLFMWDGHLDFPDHTVITNLFWGIENTEGAMKNIFNTPMCVIEIVNLKFSRQDMKC